MISRPVLAKRTCSSVTKYFEAAGSVATRRILALQPGYVIGPLARCFNGNCQVSQLVANNRILRKHLSISLGFLAKPDQVFQVTLEPGSPARSGSFKVHPGHGNVPALIYLTNYIPLWNPDAVKENLIVYVGSVHEVQRTYGDSRPVHLTQEVSEPPCASEHRDLF